MSPVRPTAGSVILSLIVALLASASVASAAAEPGAPAIRVITIGVLDEAGCPAGAAAPCWDTNKIAVRPGDTVSLVADLTTSVIPHNLWVREGTEDAPGVTYVPAATAEGKHGTAERPKTYHIANFTVPADYDGAWKFVCTVHPTAMVGDVLLPEAFAAGGAHAEPIHHLGVNFLSYWVGLIAFMILFVVYGLTFFLFKYNETTATTDHWDRPGSGDGGRRFSPGVASLLALGIAAVLLGGIIYAARM